MGKTKAKRDIQIHIQILPFAIIWALSTVITGYIASTFMRIFLYPLLTSELAGAASNFVPILVTGMVQVVLVERLLKRSMGKWMLYTTVSGLATLFLIHGVARSMIYSQNFNSDFYMLVNLIAYYVPASILQYVWLRRRVNRAWLWPFASILFTLAFSLRGLLSSDYTSSFFTAMVQFLSYSIIQASLMYSLWQHPKDTEKAKIDFAADDQSDEMRLTRLQEQERHNPLWDLGNNQALQSEA